MSLRRKIIGLTLLFSIILSQGPFNGYGIGDMQNWKSASEGGASSIGLVSSYRNNVSLSNPATWSSLKFTFLSIYYIGFEYYLMYTLFSLKSLIFIRLGQIVQGLPKSHKACPNRTRLGQIMQAFFFGFLTEII